MVRWLGVAAALGLAASTGAQAQMKGLGAIELAEVAKNRTLDLRITQNQSYDTGFHLAPNMLVHQDFGTSAAVGLGLANMYQRRRAGDYRPGSVRSRKPAVTFQIKF